MKNLLKIFTIAITFGLCCVLTSAAPANETSISTDESCVDEELVVEVLEDALHCSVKVGENEASCWFCDCRALLEQLQC